MHNQQPENSLQAAVLDLYGLDCAQVETLSTSATPQTIFAQIRLKPQYPKCPECGHSNSKIKGYVTKRITHSALTQRNCILLYECRRYVCPKCHKTWQENNPFAFKKQRLSIKTVQCILDDLHSPSATFSEVAARHHISPTTAQNLFDSHIHYPKPSELPEVLLMDEVYGFKSDQSKYVCMLLDFKTTEAVDILPSRRLDYLEEYFLSFPAVQRNKVRYISTDMYEGYRTVVRRYFKSAKHGVDPFHVVQEYTRRLTDVRIRLMKGAEKNSERCYLLKHQHKLLNIRPEAARKSKDGSDSKVLVLDPSDPGEYNKFYKGRMNKFKLLKKLLDISPDLETAYDFRNMLQDFYRQETAETAADKLNELILFLDHSQVPELMKFRGTLNTWFREIVNSFSVIDMEYRVSSKSGGTYVKERRLTSSLIENKNGIVKTLKKVANGFSCWERFRNRVMYVLDKNPTYTLYPKRLVSGK